MEKLAVPQPLRRHQGRNQGRAMWEEIPQALQHLVRSQGRERWVVPQRASHGMPKLVVPQPLRQHQGRSQGRATWEELLQALRQGRERWVVPLLVLWQLGRSQGREHLAVRHR